MRYWLRWPLPRACFKSAGSAEETLELSEARYEAFAAWSNQERGFYDGLFENAPLREKVAAINIGEDELRARHAGRNAASLRTSTLHTCRLFSYIKGRREKRKASAIACVNTAASAPKMDA